MTAPTITADDDAFAEAVGDAALLGLLRSKPIADEVPTAVWWLIAETLRTSVALRRCIEGPPQKALFGPDDSVEDLHAEALLLTEAALAELAEATGAHPTPLSEPDDAPSKHARPAFALQLSVLFLARMLVSQQATMPQRLANTLAAHLRALVEVCQRDCQELCVSGVA